MRADALCGTLRPLALLLLPAVLGGLYPSALYARAETAGARPPALVLEAGSVAHRQMVAVGRDLVVAGEAREDAAALEGRIRILGRVHGDVIALGGDVELAASARVDGDVYSLGGHIRAAPGSTIGGRSVSYPSASAAWLTLIEGPTLGLSPFSPLVVGAKIGLLAAWLLLVLALFSISGREMLATSASVASEPGRSFVVGLTGVCAMALTALALTTLAVAVVGVPLLVLVVLVALVLKLWGMVGVFHALGDALGRRLLGRRLRSLHAATLGLLVLGVVKFLPYVGVWVWTAATLIGVGAALTTKMGRREPWLRPEAQPAMPVG